MELMQVIVFPCRRGFLISNKDYLQSVSKTDTTASIPAHPISVSGRGAAW